MLTALYRLMVFWILLSLVMPVPAGAARKPAAKGGWKMKRSDGEEEVAEAQGHLLRFYGLPPSAIGCSVSQYVGARCIAHTLS